MAFRGTPSPSPSSNTSSCNTSPAILNVSLMAPAPDDSDPPSRTPSTRGTPNRAPIDLPRSQASSKGGCWTCRLRRKKCDEQRVGDSCKTCIRLTIDCLGWGPKRPDWMRDKQAVEAYKANIKAQLTRAGLIRGQPRSSLIQAQAQLNGSGNNSTRASSNNNSSNRSTRPPAYHRLSAPVEPTSHPSPTNSLGLEGDLSFGYRYGNLIPGVAGASNSTFHQLPVASYSDPNLTGLDLGTPFFQQQYSPQTSSLGSEPHEFDFAGLAVPQNHVDFNFDIRPPSPIQNIHAHSSSASTQENHVMYYFENVRKLHFLLGSNAITNVTYSYIVQEPRGAVTNAVCALASLHYSRMRVAQGLEAPDPNPDLSVAKYFHDEAYLQLASAKQINGRHSESDVLAALHLVCFSQMTVGTATNWQFSLNIALDWLISTGLPTSENPMVCLSNMSMATQLIVKCTIWMDILSSLTLIRPPKFVALYQRLWAEGDSSSGLWGANGNGMNAVDMSFPFNGLQMELLTGWPDDALLGISEVSALAQWKAAEQRKGSLSMRELIRRGDEIEQRLRSHSSDSPSAGSGSGNGFDLSPLNHLTGLPTPDSPGSFPHHHHSDDDISRKMNRIFREAVLLYLHTVMSDSNPSVAEISHSVDTVVHLLQQVPPSEMDRVLVFPICLTACLTDDSLRRDYLKTRLHAQDETAGNLMRALLLMEAVWQKRDVTGKTIDWREMMGERNLNLLLI